MIHFDEDIEECWNKGYEDIFFDPIIKKKNKLI
jgi:hypothetical protein